MSRNIAVILAAGKGVRMRSELPKVMHKVANLPMITHVVRAARAAGVDNIVVVTGHGREQLMESLAGEGLAFVVQEQQLGTGHALMQAGGLAGPDDTIMVLCGDTPLLRGDTLKNLLAYHHQTGAVATVLTTRVKNPAGYGRIVRDQSGRLERIVEDKDASPEIKAIDEINSGMYCFQAGPVFAALQDIEPVNAQGEYYLTDVLPLFLAQGLPVEVLLHPDEEELYGVNDRIQLAYAERVLRRRKNHDLMTGGVTIMDPATTFIDVDVRIGMDTVILPFTIIAGDTTIGSNCTIGPGSHIIDSSLGNNVVVENSKLLECQVDDDCTIGPFAYLRPQAVLKRGAKVGDFVEIKKSTIGEKSKVPHLAYVGDALVGTGVNIGAGTITCNYDGRNKHVTVIEDGAFIGSNTNLVAPVRIGKNATTGAGSTITKEVPDEALGVERARQKNISDWAKRKNSPDDAS